MFTFLYTTISAVYSARNPPTPVSASLWSYPENEGAASVAWGDVVAAKCVCPRPFPGPQRRGRSRVYARMTALGRVRLW